MNKLANLADELEYPSRLPCRSAYRNAREKVISKAIDNRYFRDRYYPVNGEYRSRIGTKARAKIHVFCPPLLQYIHFALALSSPDYGLKPCEFQVVIHPDDRLLSLGRDDIVEGFESMLQLNDFVRSHAESGEPIDYVKLGMQREGGHHFLATRFDQVWMDQRITAVGSDKRTADEVDASEYFRNSKEAVEVALIIIMAGPLVCTEVTSTAPLALPSDPVGSSQIYKLQELADVDDESQFRWKTTHFCQINLP